MCRRQRCVRATLAESSVRGVCAGTRRRDAACYCARLRERGASIGAFAACPDLRLPFWFPRAGCALRTGSTRRGAVECATRRRWPVGVGKLYELLAPRHRPRRAHFPPDADAFWNGGGTRGRILFRGAGRWSRRGSPRRTDRPERAGWESRYRRDLHMQWQCGSRLRGVAVFLPVWSAGAALAGTSTAAAEARTLASPSNHGPIEYVVGRPLAPFRCAQKEAAPILRGRERW